MQKPQHECDIIMKGGITSGVVYPEAILELSRNYRFRCIGGTSAGAIAAVITAAAQYGEGAEANGADKGFAVLRRLPGMLKTDLAKLFQPAPALRSFFRLLMAVLDKPGEGASWLRRVFHTIKLVALVVPCGGVAGPIVALLALIPLVMKLCAAPLPAWGGADYALGGLSILAALVVLVLVSAVAGVMRFMKRLEANDYGLCPGSGEPTGDVLPLSDWLTRLIDEAAGRMPGGKPLVFKDLRLPPGEGAKPITLKTVTTNLNMRRPHALPYLGDRNWYFDADEWRRLVPAYVVDYMVAEGTRKLEETRARREARGEPFFWPTYNGRRLYSFPGPSRLPLIVTARMSLSFPFLISAVPLYRVDYPMPAGANGLKPMRRVLFSDGGLSSNFPIHFFDSFLPKRPTFGITLDAFDEELPGRRVRLPMDAADGQWLSIGRKEGIATFLLSLFDAAKDWQDNLQSVMPGYRERIAHVYLKSDEGGINLNMPAETIEELVSLGKRAGLLMSGAKPDERDKSLFDFDDHRWRRFLVFYAALEDALEDAATEWQEQKEGFRALMEAPPSYANPGNKEARAELYRRIDSLLTHIANEWPEPLRDRDHLVPKPAGKLRITPRY
ncbi:patatin-like phospholipase family protein [Kordiimonas gwangyangensis]|uniref:patatin-like phospholipase family protein n=2 Tax=Kordiimonas gwangyangensis TaxID=288022 RepID=UPI00036ED44F|nr:patatin-like phospholipase family protein [Kordiimonas gwangyangensis]